ncbi:MAG: hypothetical protein HC782_04850 [Gammaproteobacteria bacterium]|nr:hypothetical protein [Gammaproteobacteria bacterium]
MTATPVELYTDQWDQMLGRIEVKDTKANDAIKKYASAVSKVRQTLHDQAVRDEFFLTAHAFKEALDPYLLRRDKREDSYVKIFQEKSGTSYHAYRRQTDIQIDTANLSLDWNKPCVRRKRSRS